VVKVDYRDQEAAMPYSHTVELPCLQPKGRLAVTGSDVPGGARLPMRGLTVLAVEDSRFASEALRLMCQRSGARLRRAETLAAARGHLRLYRPDVVIVDLGLPDGRGEVLIRDLVLTAVRPMVILGTSGLASGRTTALAAGADGFLEKPVESLAAFQRATIGIASFEEDPPPLAPDLLALRDDLSRAAERLAADPDAGTRRYVAGFVQGLARLAHDPALAAAAAGCAAPGAGVEGLQRIIAARLAGASGGFGRVAGL